MTLARTRHTDSAGPHTITSTPHLRATENVLVGRRLLLDRVLAEKVRRGLDCHSPGLLGCVVAGLLGLSTRKRLDPVEVDVREVAALLLVVPDARPPPVEALKPGGKTFTVEFVPNPDRVTPPMAAAFSLVMLAHTDSGDAYTFAEYEKMHCAAGFKSCSLHPVADLPQQVVVAEK